MAADRLEAADAGRQPSGPGRRLVRCAPGGYREPGACGAAWEGLSGAWGRSAPSWGSGCPGEPRVRPGPGGGRESDDGGRPRGVGAERALLPCMDTSSQPVAAAFHGCRRAVGVDCAPAYAWPSSVQRSRLVSMDLGCLLACDTGSGAPRGPLGLAASELLGAHFRRCTAACRISVCLGGDAQQAGS